MTINSSPITVFRQAPIPPGRHDQVWLRLENRLEAHCASQALTIPEQSTELIYGCLALAALGGLLMAWPAHSLWISKVNSFAHYFQTFLAHGIKILPFLFLGGLYLVGLIWILTSARSNVSFQGGSIR